MIYRIKLFILLVAVTACSTVQEPGNNKFIYCENGRLYHPNGEEVSLWGVNLQPCLSWEYYYYIKKTGFIPKDPEVWKRMVDNSLDELETLNCQVIRCHLTPADFTDAGGNITETFYLDMLDYMISEAGKRGIYLYFAFLNHMSFGEVENTFLSMAPEWGDRPKWIVDEEFIVHTKNYIEQLLERINPYTGTAYKNEPMVAVWELINEPLYYSFDAFKETPYYNDFEKWLNGQNLKENESNYKSYRKQLVLDYIDGMYDVVRKTGAKQPVVWSCNWHKMMQGRKDVFEAISESKVEVVSFCNYPGQDVCKHPYLENPEDLTRHDFSEWFKNCYNIEEWYGWMLTDAFKDKAKVVYEFETFYNQSAYLYPAQAKLFRALGAQIATMWHYAMPDYAPFVNGSHFLNLKCTPRKAASFAVAGSIFNHLPLYGLYGPDATTEDLKNNYMFSYKKDLSIYANEEKYFHSGSVSGEEEPKPHPGTKQIIGYGNSPLVEYDGSGVYRLDISEDQINISIEPDSKWLREPWQRDLLKYRVTELDSSAVHIMTLQIRGWNSDNCRVFELHPDGEKKMAFIGGELRFKVTPGKYKIRKNE